MDKMIRAAFLLPALTLLLVGLNPSGGRLAVEAPPAYASAEPDVTTTPPTMAQVVDDDDDRHHGMWGDWDDWGWWLFMPMMVVFWVGVIAVVVWLARQAGSGGGRGNNANDAIEIARQRYARGEIDREQFEQIRRDLSSR